MRTENTVVKVKWNFDKIRKMAVDKNHTNEPRGEKHRMRIRLSPDTYNSLVTMCLKPSTGEYKLSKENLIDAILNNYFEALNDYKRN